MEGEGPDSSTGRPEGWDEGALVPLVSEGGAMSVYNKLAVLDPCWSARSRSGNVSDVSVQS